jgi:biopolymer transport protein ExbB
MPRSRRRPWLGLNSLGLCLAFLLLATARVAMAQETVEQAEAETTQNFLRWMFDASGWIGVIILLMSFYLVALVSWMAFHFRRVVALPPRLVDDLNELLGRKQYTEAYSRLTGDGSFFAKVLAAGVRRLPAGAAQAQRAMELANDDASMAMEHRTTYLATVGTLGPMIGLVGTVYGMILSFRVIATAGSSPQASALAAGISTALFATLEGIAISIPAIYFHAMYRNRIARISLEVALAAEGLLELFTPGLRSLHPQLQTGTGLPMSPQRPPMAAPTNNAGASSAASSSASTSSNPEA